MKFQIRHHISWQYDRPVFIEPMTIRLRPRCDGSLDLTAWQLSINPEPAGLCDSLDALGNAVSLAWFNEPHDTLTVNTVSSVETTRANPFNYLLTDQNSQKLPFDYGESMRNLLSVYLQRVSVDERIDKWANGLAAADGDTQSFLSLLTTTMSKEFERTTRQDGPALAVAETFEARRGACRDLTVLFIDACRAVGIASRFVSGYAFEPEREESNDLHAWAEVYLLGAGWRGYDPTLGLAVADQHIPLAAAPEPKAAAPSSGTFRGTGAKSKIKFRIEIQTMDDT